MFRILLTAFSLIALPVAAAAQVRVDYDRHQTFSHYRTFDIDVGPLVRPDGSTDEQNTLAEDRLRRAIATELVSRGFESTTVGADLLVRVSSRDSERTAIMSSGFNTFPTYWYRPVRYRRGGHIYTYYTYWGRPFYDHIWTRRYLEGALTVNVIAADVVDP